MEFKTSCTCHENRSLQTNNITYTTLKNILIQVGGGAFKDEVLTLSKLYFIYIGIIYKEVVLGNTCLQDFR